jgi:hypothetical protein
MVSTCGRFLVLGGNPLHGSDALDSRMGVLSLGQRTGDGIFVAPNFWGGLLLFIMGGGGPGKRNSRARLPRRFRRTTRVPNSPVYVIYFTFRSGGFTAACVRQSRTVDPILDTLGRHVRCFRSRQPVDLVHVLKTVKGLLLLVPPRTPRSSGYDVYADVVYVVICYMYMSVICCYMLYVCYRLCLLYV